MFDEGRKDLLESESELLSLVRGRVSEDFSITIMRSGDRWIVSQSNRQLSRVPEMGRGENFDQAWNMAGVFSA